MIGVVSVSLYLCEGRGGEGAREKELSACSVGALIPYNVSFIEGIN